MKRKLIALLLLFCLSLTGCASMLERDYVVVSPYQPVSNQPGSSSALRAENYQDLVNAILHLVIRGETQGVVNLYNYTQDVETDLTRACLEVIQEDPLGAYSVEYISHDYSLIVSYYEVHLQITYRRSREQVASITTVTGSSAIRKRISQALTEFSPETVLRITFFAENEAYIQDLVEQAYYNSPATALGMPETTINIYPNSGYQRIVEITLTYPESTEALRRQNRQLTGLAMNMITEQSTARTLYESLATDLTISSAPGKSSAYHALVEKEANREGAALAYQLLCDRAGVECYLVRGLLNGVPHFWNIVCNETGVYRHVDLSAGLFDLTDEDLAAFGTYVWDTREYPPCPAPPIVEEIDPDEKN